MVGIHYLVIILFMLIYGDDEKEREKGEGKSIKRMVMSNVTIFVTIA